LVLAAEKPGAAPGEAVATNWELLQARASYLNVTWMIGSWEAVNATGDSLDRFKALCYDKCPSEMPEFGL